MTSQEKFHQECKSLSVWFTKGGVTDEVIVEASDSLGTLLPKVTGKTVPSERREAMTRIATAAKHLADGHRLIEQSGPQHAQWAEARRELMTLLPDYLRRYPEPVAEERGQRYVLQRGAGGAQDVYDTTHEPHRRIGSIKFEDVGKHAAFDADGNSLGVHAGGNEAKDAVIHAYPDR